MKMIDLDIDLLCKLFEYDPTTGSFLRIGLLHNKSKEIIPCRREITANTKGHLQVGIGKKVYYVHRVIWLMMTGNFPNEIDHINGIRSDNRWENLREVTHQENAKNTGIGRNNTSGFLGVSFNKATGKFSAYLKSDLGRVHLGSFSDPHDANNAVMMARKEEGYHQNHGARQSW